MQPKNYFKGGNLPEKLCIKSGLIPNDVQFICCQSYRVMLAGLAPSTNNWLWQAVCKLPVLIKWDLNTNQLATQQWLYLEASPIASRYWVGFRSYSLACRVVYSWSSNCTYSEGPLIQPCSPASMQHRYPKQYQQHQEFSSGLLFT